MMSPITIIDIDGSFFLQGIYSVGIGKLFGKIYLCSCVFHNNSSFNYYEKKKQLNENWKETFTRKTKYCFCVSFQIIQQNKFSNTKKKKKTYFPKYFIYIYIMMFVKEKRERTKS